MGPSTGVPAGGVPSVMLGFLLFARVLEFAVTFLVACFCELEEFVFEALDFETLDPAETEVVELADLLTVVTGALVEDFSVDWARLVDFFEAFFSLLTVLTC